MNVQIIELFNQIYQFIQSKSDDKTKIRIVFHHPDFYQHVSKPFMYLKDYSPEILLDCVDNFMQSNRSIRLDENFKFWIYFLNIPLGSSFKGMDKIIEHYFLKTSCIKLVENKDNYCAVRSILIAQAYIDKNKVKISHFSKLNNRVFEDETKKIVKNCNIPNTECTINETKIIEMFLRKYQISVIDKNGEFIYIGPNNDKSIYLWNYKDHFFPITNISKFYESKYFCDKCKKPYESFLNHKCASNSELCNRQKCYKSKQINVNSVQKFLTNRNASIFI
ncbi:unnamed protein product [Brachionus calyciflorus]|uniref:Uncharacterized protein n=1 Tax=Brachionus calyciflorus TaxID=104777 RepID=A0A813NMA6_9BILA|nr:unnamed protein product [Brachionus calyciflorus]